MRPVQMIGGGTFDLVFPSETAADLRSQVNNKSSLRNVIRDSTVEELIATLSRAAVPVEFRQFEHSECPDPKDVCLLDAARSGNADFLITGDKPLLRMPKPPPGTSIVTPAEFLMLRQALRDRRW